MSAMKSSVGVPVQLMREAEGHFVSIEMKSGELYRGRLDSSEETMSCQLRDVVHTGKDGRVSRLEHVYIRGNQVRFMVLPDILKNAPIFARVKAFAEAKAKPVLPKVRPRSSR